MLTRIKSAIFTEKVIEFHEGLNVVLGDNNGSNSIGKSTLLMILDFIFGGDTYTSHNKDVITNLGHHDFEITFKFNNKELHFIRGTEKPDRVYKINQENNDTQEIKTNDYRKELKYLYSLEFENLAFRGAVSTFSRVWGKENYNVRRPLHNHPQENFIQTVTKLIKLFNKYGVIELHDKELKKLEGQRKILNSADNHKLIPKITKKKFSNNKKEIESLLKEIERLSKNVYSPYGDINEIVSEEMISLREEKKLLIDKKEYYLSRLNRTTRTIKRTTDAEFESLLEFFPDVNLKKLQNIESFHKDITSILSEELKNAKKELELKIDKLDEEINIIITKQERLLHPDEEVNVFIDNIIELSSTLKNLQLENQYYQKLTEIRGNIKSKKEELGELKEAIVKDIGNTINASLSEINDIIYDDKRTAPELNLTYDKYNYEFFDNTATGRAYADLLIFDLAILSLTKLPFIIHDSFLFKNIEKEAVEQIVQFYSSISKQVFIAIDIIEMYDQKTQNILEDKKVIQLSQNKLLTILDWRDNSKKNID